MNLIHTRAAHAVHRPGHKSFTSTIADRLDANAKESVIAAYLRDELESMRRGKKVRNAA